MKLYLVDDNEEFRKNLKVFLELFLKYKVVGEASDGSEIDMENLDYPDIILMDLNMPDINGFQATQKCNSMNQNVKVIALSQYKEISDSKHLISIGFNGFVSKTNLFDELDKAIKTVYKGKYYFSNYQDITKY